MLLTLKSIIDAAVKHTEEKEGQTRDSGARIKVE
jgi:hypothetical protein